MEFSQHLPNLDDARDLFLLAKERLLDVNDWNSMLTNTDYHITLTNPNGQKQHRDARVGDLIRFAGTNQKDVPTEKWIEITIIQYDFFPDIRSESISMLLNTASYPSTGNVENQETILIKREGLTITAHCNAGNELPGEDAETPDEHINNHIELHPVLNLSIRDLQHFIQQLIAIYEHT